MAEHKYTDNITIREASKDVTPKSEAKVEEPKAPKKTTKKEK